MNAKLINKFIVDTNADIVGGVTQQTFDNYAAKHRAQFPSIYVGDGTAQELDLKFHYNIGGPLTFILAQSKKSSDAFKRRILSDPFLYLNKPLFREKVSAPTIKVNLPKTIVNFFTTSGTHLADVTLTGNITAAVLVDSTPPGQYTLEVLNVEIHIQETKFMADKSLDGCDLNKLIEYILDSVLKSSLTRFLEQFPLPQPHFSLVGLNTTLQSVQIVESTLLVSLGVRQSQHKQLVTDTHTLSGETMERAIFGKALQRKIETPGDGTLKATMNLQKKTRPTDLTPVDFREIPSGSLPNGDMFLSVSNNVFQLLANKYLNINVEKESSSGGYAHYYYKYGYAVNSPTASIVNSGVQVKAQLAGNASGGAGLSGCSSVLSVSIGADAHAVPQAMIDAELLAHNGGRELWVHPFDFPFLIAVSVWMKPNVPGLNFILSLVASSLLSLFSAVILPLISLALEIKLISLPESIPGTPVVAKPTVNTVGNWDGMLLISFNLNFN